MNITVRGGHQYGAAPFANRRHRAGHLRAQTEDTSCGKLRASAILEARYGALFSTEASVDNSGTASGQRRPGERRADVQGLRGIAVLLVVAFHAGLPVPGGFVGVDVFFVISGFVIARLLLAQLEVSGRLELRRFYTRRVRRLLPALSLLIITVSVVSILLLSPLGPQQATARTGIGASLFAANLQLLRTPTGYFDLGATANALLHTWSLSLEEQFYLVFPLSLYFAWHIGAKHIGPRGGRRAAGAFVAAATLASFALCWYTSHGHGDGLAHRLGGNVARFTFYVPATRAWEFGIGVLCALGKWQLSAPGRYASESLGVLGIAMVFGGALLISDAVPFPGAIALLPVCGTGLLIVGGTRGANSASWLLRRRFLVWLGDRSYSWYLWHWPAIVICRALWPTWESGPCLAAVISLGIANASYRFVENPIRFNDGITATRSIWLAAACIATSLTMAFGLLFASRIEGGGAAARGLSRALRHHADELRGCSDSTNITPRGGRCTWHVAQARGEIVLIGDSNAGHFTEPAVAAAATARFDLTVATRADCPFVDLNVNVPRHDATACHRFVRTTLQELERRRPSLVIVASSSTYYLDSNQVTLRDPRTGEIARDRDQKARLWETGTHAVVASLGRAGIPVLLVHAAPKLKGFAPATCPYVDMLVGADACALNLPRATIEQQQAAARRAEDRAIAGVPGAAAADFTDELCSPSSCASRRGGVWLYRDSGHLSVDGARSLAPQMTHLIIEGARPGRQLRRNAAAP